MPTKVKARRKPTQVSSRSSRSSSKKKTLRFRYTGNSKTSKDTKRINHPNFVDKLSTNYVDIHQRNLNITKDNHIADNISTDYVKFVRDVYPQVKDYLYIFEHELSSKHLDPKEFALWIMNGLSELNQSDDLIAFDYNSNSKKYVANVIKSIHDFNGGCCQEMYWMNNLSENDNRRMLETCIKMLVEDVKLSTYWHTYPNGEVELNSNVEDYIDFAREEADNMTDREEAEYHINMINDYETIALDLAKSIMGRTIDYYEVLEYSESNKKYSKFAELAWKLVKHNFRIWKYSSVAHIKHNEFINLNDPYIGIEQIFQFFYRIDESDPIFWHLDQEFQSNANEYGVEEACTIVPISNPEQFDHQKDMWNTFVELFKTFQSYG